MCDTIFPCNEQSLTLSQKVTVIAYSVAMNNNF